MLSVTALWYPLLVDPPADCKTDEECKDQERKFCEGGRCSQCRQTSGTFVEVLQVPTPKLPYLCTYVQETRNEYFLQICFLSREVLEIFIFCCYCRPKKIKNYLLFQDCSEEQECAYNEKWRKMCVTVVQRRVKPGGGRV